jgi:hypothetical protein
MDDHALTEIAELDAFKRPRRRVVERTFAWLYSCAI